MGFMGDFHDDRFSPGAAHRQSGGTPSRGYEEPPQVAKSFGHSQHKSYHKSYDQLRLVEVPEQSASDHRSDNPSRRSKHGTKHATKHVVGEGESEMRRGEAAHGNVVQGKESRRQVGPESAPSRSKPRVDKHSDNPTLVAGKDRWNPSGNSKWKRVEGDAYAGESRGSREVQTKKVPVTTTSGEPVYQAKYGQTTVYGWRSSEGVANFSDQKPPMKAVSTPEQPKGGSGWGNK